MWKQQGFLTANGAVEFLNSLGAAAATAKVTFSTRVGQYVVFYQQA